MTAEEQKAADEKAAAEKAAADATKAKPDPVNDDEVFNLFKKMKAEQDSETKARQAREEREAKLMNAMKAVMQGAEADEKTKGGVLHKAPAFNSRTSRGDSEGQAFNYYLRTGDRGAYKALVIMNEADDESGGAAVPTDFYNQVVMLRDPLSVVRQAPGCRFIQTSGLTINIPTYATRFTAPAQTNESGAATAVSRTINEVEPLDTVPVTVVDYTFLLRLSKQLVNDAKFNLDAFIQQAIGQNYAVLENTLCAAAVIAGVTNTVDADDNLTISIADLYRLYYDLDSPYREGASWLMPGATEGAVRQLVTASAFAFGATPQGASGTVGQQWIIGPGNRVFNLTGLEALGADNKVIFFGNFQHYAVVENGGLSIQRLNERFADTGEIGFVASFRTAHKVLHGGEAWSYLRTLSS